MRQDARLGNHPHRQHLGQHLGQRVGQRVGQQVGVHPGGGAG
jgi:hypothetical protein